MKSRVDVAPLEVTPSSRNPDEDANHLESLYFEGRAQSAAKEKRAERLGLSERLTKTVVVFNVLIFPSRIKEAVGKYTYVFVRQGRYRGMSEDEGVEVGNVL